MLTTIKSGKPLFEQMPPEVAKLIRAMALPEKEEDLPHAFRSDKAPPVVRQAGRKREVV